MSWFNRYSAGVVTDTVNDISRLYTSVLHATYVFEMDKMAHWRQLYAWGKHVALVVSLTDKAGPYLHTIRERYGTPMVGVRYSHWQTVYDYDALYDSWQIGWGVDKKRYKDIAANRRPKPKPTFHMLSPDRGIENALSSWGYRVRTGTSYYLSDVALEPGKIVVPAAMYEAAASGMPVISIKENEPWTKVLGVYEGLFLDGSLRQTVDIVCNSDFLYAGMIAMDMVPSLGEFRTSIRELLKHLRTG